MAPPAYTSAGAVDATSTPRVESRPSPHGPCAAAAARPARVAAARRSLPALPALRGRGAAERELRALRLGSEGTRGRRPAPHRGRPLLAAPAALPGAGSLRVSGGAR